MAEPEKTEKSSRFVVGSVIFICAVMLSYVLDRYTGFSILDPLGTGQTETDGQAESSLQPAVDACKRAARAQIGAALLSTRMDPTSTRYMGNRKEYLVILDVRIKGRDREAYYYECNVSAVSKQVTRTRLNGPPGSFEQIGIE